MSLIFRDAIGFPPVYGTTNVVLGGKADKKESSENILDKIIEHLSDIGFIRNKSNYKPKDILDSGLPLNYVKMPYEFMPEDTKGQGTFKIVGKEPESAIEIISPGGDTFIELSFKPNKIVDLSNHELVTYGCRVWMYIMIFPANIGPGPIKVYCRMPLSFGGGAESCNIGSMISKRGNFAVIEFDCVESMIGELWKNCQIDKLPNHFEEVVNSVNLSDKSNSNNNYNRINYIDQLLRNADSELFKLRENFAIFMSTMSHKGPYTLFEMENAVLPLLPKHSHIPLKTLANSIGRDMYYFVFGDENRGRTITREEYYQKADEIIKIKENIGLYPYILEI